MSDLQKRSEEWKSDLKEGSEEWKSDLQKRSEEWKWLEVEAIEEGCV